MRLLKWLFVMVFVVGSVIGVGAQDEPTTLAEGLNAPRHLWIDPADGTIYVVEAGSGGDIETETVAGPVLAGNSGRVTAISTDGTQEVVLDGFFSVATEFGEVNGANTVYATDTTIWVLVGQGPTGANRPPDNPVFSLVAIDRATGDLTQAIDLYANEEANDPDGEGLDSNPIGLAVAEDGTAFIADAGANALLKVTPDGTVSTFAFWQREGQQPSAVPTSVALGADGNLYVGFLTGFPFPEGGSRIEVLDATGALVKQYDGLTMVTDVFFGADGTLYAVQFASGLGEQGYAPDSGSIVAVSDEGITPVVTGLNFPFGARENSDGSFVVAANSAFVPADSGVVLSAAPGSIVAAPATTEEAPEPATTEEAGS